MMLEKIFFLAVLSFILADYLSLSSYLSYTWVKINVVVFIFLSVYLFLKKNVDIRFYYCLFILFFFIIGALLGIRANKISNDSILNYVEQRGIITGEVVYNSWQNYDNGYASFVLQVKSFTYDDKTVVTSGKVKVSLSKVPENTRLSSSSMVSFGGEVKPLTTLHNPSGKNMIEYNYRQDIYGYMTVKYNNIAIESKQNLLSKLEEFLQKTKENMQKTMPKNDQAIIFAMLFGGYSDIDEVTIDSFSTVGLIHILSVSGAHVAIIAGFILYITRKIGFSKKKAAFLAVLSISFYAVLCGLSVPVVRSAVMGIVLLIGLMLERKSNVSNILGMVCVFMLIYEPRWIFDISFQLSFLAVAGLVYLVEPIKERLNFLSDVISSGLAITLAVQITTLPFIAYYFYKMPLLAFLANILILPVLELCLLLSLVALFLYMAIPLVGSFIFVCASLLLGFAVRCSEWLANLDFAIVFIPYLPEWFWLCYYVVVLICFSLLPIDFYCRTRRSVLVGFIVLSIMFFWTNSLGNHFAVHFIDVGQGDACLVITPSKKAILFDTGMKSDYSGYDVGKQVVVPYLRHYGIKEINLLVLSHGHNDHAGGAAAISKQIPIQEIWLPNEEASNSIERFLAVSKYANKVIMYDNQKIVLDGVEVEVVYAADLGYLPKKKNNETSAVVKMSYMGKSFLFTGDATKDIELKVIPMLEKIDVLKVSHHGSKTSSNKDFINKIKPDIAVISVAVNNAYGHPAVNTLKTLYKACGKVARTDLDGAILVKLEKDKLVLYSYRKNPKAF